MAILTVSREYGSGGKDIGRRVAREMGYDYIDRGRILEDMRKEGPQWEEAAKYFDENNPDSRERFEWSFRGFVALTQAHFLDHALRDNVVIMGRGGSFLLKGVPYALRIRTRAPLEQRIERVMTWEETNKENARALIERADQEMKGAVYLVYGHDWDDADQYDMVFDTNLQPVDIIVSIVQEGLKEKEAFNTEEARQLLGLRAKAARIKADLVTDRNLFISSLAVKLKEETMAEYGLVVEGSVHNEKDIKEIEERVRKRTADIPVDFDIKYRMQSRVGPLTFR